METGGRFPSSSFMTIWLCFILQAALPVAAHAEAFHWMRTYSGAANRGDQGHGMAVAADGSVFVTGATHVAGQSHNLLLLKYSPGGSLLWMKTNNGAANGGDRGVDVAVAADGSVYVAGHTYVTGLSHDLLLRKYK